MKAISELKTIMLYKQCILTFLLAYLLNHVLHLDRFCFASPQFTNATNYLNL